MCNGFKFEHPHLCISKEDELNWFFQCYTGLPGWRNGIRNMEISQPSFHDQRNGRRA